MATYLITGGARGLGLALAKSLVARPDADVARVIVSARAPSAELESLANDSAGRVRVVSFDVADEQSIQRAVPDVEAALEGAGAGLDVLINNAGVAPFSPDGVASMDELDTSLRINVLGVHWVTRAFLPLLEKGKLKKVANISTTMGSIAMAPQYAFAPAPAYKISKSALNALTVQYALEYGPKGFSFTAISPGWLKTELGGGDMADLTAEQGALATLEIIDKPSAETNGQFTKVRVAGWENVPGPNVYDGKNAPW